MQSQRTALTLFGRDVQWYGILIVLGILMGFMVAKAREKRFGLPKDTAIDLVLCCVPAAIVGARLYYVIFSIKLFSGQPWWKIFAIWEGGMAIYGGVIAGVFVGWLYARAKKLRFLTLADLAAPSIALGQAVGRWGNFVNQEAHGALVESPALRFFPAAVFIDGGWYYATFFYESAWCLLIVAALLIAEHRRFFKRTGDGFFAYVFLYALERGVVEGMRTDSLYLGAMRVSQGLSLLAAACIAALWAFRARRAPRMLRALCPACTLAAIAFAAFGRQTGIFLSALLALISAVSLAVFEYKFKSDLQIDEQERKS